MLRGDRSAKKLCYIHSIAQFALNFPEINVGQ